jgi:hypothetical protein
MAAAGGGGVTVSGPGVGGTVGTLGSVGVSAGAEVLVFVGRGAGVGDGGSGNVGVMAGGAVASTPSSWAAQVNFR